MTGVVSGAVVGKSSFSLLFPFSWVANWNLGIAPRRTDAVSGAETSKGSLSEFRTDWAAFSFFSSDSWATN